MSHTPGPWQWSRDLSDDQFSLRTRDYDAVIEAVGGGSYDDAHYISGEADDLRLIAAAPDLLAALKGLADQWSGKRLDQGGAYSTDEDATMIAARAAIAKAEGKP